MIFWQNPADLLHLYMISFWIFITRWPWIKMNQVHGSFRCQLFAKWIRKIPEPWKIQLPSSNFIHIDHNFECILSRTACDIQIDTKCAFLDFINLMALLFTVRALKSKFKVWVLDGVNQIHQVKHVAEIEFLFTFQFLTLLMDYSCTLKI